MVGNLGAIGVGIADTMMIGNTGVDNLAAVSLGNSVTLISLFFGIGVSIGVTPIIASLKDYSNIKSIYWTSFLTNIFFGISLFVLTVVSGYLLFFLNQPAHIVRLTIPYLFLIGLSFIPFMAFQTFKQYSEALYHTKFTMLVVLSGNTINIILNYLLIFGEFGFPRLGLLGAGYATLISRVLMALSMYLYLYKVKWNSAYFAQKKQWSLNMAKKILNIGVPSGFQFIFEVGAFSFVYIMVGWIDVNSLASHQIAINLAGISYMEITGLAAASTVIIGNEFGNKDYRSIKVAAFASFSLSLFIMSLFSILFITANNFLPLLYISDVDVIQIASNLLIIASFFQISDGLQAVGLGILRGLHDVKIPTLITIFSYWIVAIPVGYILAFSYKLGVYGIWYGLLIGLTVAAFLLIVKIFHNLNTKIRTVTIPK